MSSTAPHLEAAEGVLLDEWAARYPSQPFCRDGMVDAESYVVAPVRVVAVLRETNVTPDARGAVEGFDVRDFLRSGKLERTYGTVARWACAACSGFPPVERVEALPRDPLVRLVRSIAVINLKKVAGQASANIAAVSAAAARDGDLLGRQIDLLAPDVVIAGGTWEHAAALCGLTVGAPVGLPQAARIGSRLLLGFHHPSARGRVSWQRDYVRLAAHPTVRGWLSARTVTPGR